MALSTHTYGIFLIVGIVAGFLSGVLGIGGGVIIVPALVLLLPSNPAIAAAQVMHVAVASSLAIMMLSSLASVYSHHRLQNILWVNYHKLWPGLVFGTVAGSVVSHVFSSQLLERMLAVFLLLIAVRMMRNKKSERVMGFPSPVVNFLVSTLIGLNSGLLGIGGGVLIVPYLHFCGVNLTRITAISAACTLTIAISGTLAFMLVENTAGLHLDNAIGAVYLPAVACIGLASCLMAPVGARLAYKLPVHYLRYLFIIILLISAVNLLV